MAFPARPSFRRAAWLPRFGGTRVHLGLIFALVAAFVLWIVLDRTKWGYEIRVIGENPRAATLRGHQPGAQHRAGDAARVGGLAGWPAWPRWRASPTACKRA